MIINFNWKQNIQALFLIFLLYRKYLTLNIYLLYLKLDELLDIKINNQLFIRSNIKFNANTSIYMNNKFGIKKFY